MAPLGAGVASSSTSAAAPGQGGEGHSLSPSSPACSHLPHDPGGQVLSPGGVLFGVFKAKHPPPLSATLAGVPF